MNTKKSIINSDILNKIDDYLLIDKNKFRLKFKLKNFKNEVLVNKYSFPYAWQNDIHTEPLKKFKFKTCYDLLNTYYNQYDEEVSKEQIKNEDCFEYIEVRFYTIPELKYKGLLNSQTHTFRFFVFYDQDKITDFRLIYNATPSFSHVEEFANSKRVDLDNIQTDEQKTGIAYLEQGFFGICQKINIEIPKEIDISKFENSIIKAPDLESFISFLSLTTRQGYDVSAYKKDAKRLQKLFEKGYNEYIYSEKIRKILSEYFLVEEEIVVRDSFFNSDWKFDPEDLIFIIEKIIGNTFSFDYPEETYSHNLFPYVQTKLAKQDLELMSVNCHGDNYFFFIANRSDVVAIQELSQSIGIEIQILK